MALPRDYMARCAQYGPRVIFEYRDDKLTPELAYLRFIGYVLASAETARRWDDRPQNLVAWYALPSWAAAEAGSTTRTATCIRPRPRPAGQPRRSPMNEREKHLIQRARGDAGRRNKEMLRWLRRIIGINRRTNQRTFYRRLRRQARREGI